MSKRQPNQTVTKGPTAAILKIEALTAHTVDSTAGRLAMTLADDVAQQTTLSLTPEVAGTLAQLMTDFARSGQPCGPQATKMPEDFAIGVARYEPIILVQFENDVPYGLTAEQAQRLGKALIAQAKQARVRPPATRQ